MFRIRKISPMVRAVGTVGAVAAIAGGITFAQTTSNTVALTDNTLSAATASLLIGNTSTTNCNGASNTSVSGMTINNLVPGGGASAPFNFCLENSGNTPLALTAQIPTAVTTTNGLNANDVNLNFVCGNDGAADGGTVNFTTNVGALQSAESFGTIADTTSNVFTCQVTASINSGISENSGAAVNPFNIQFVGTAGS